MKAAMRNLVPPTLARDLPASLVVFLVALPLCMGIAVASGVPAERGLVTGIVGGILVGLLAGSPLQVSGPAAGLAVIVFEFVRANGIDMLGPVLVLAGALQLAAGAMRLGGWFRAVSPAVVHGMLAGIGVLIVLSQVHVLWDGTPGARAAENLLAVPAAFLGFLTGEGSRLGALSVGLATIAAMLAWERLRPARLKAVPGALAGVLAGTALAALGGLDVKLVQIPADFLSGLSLPASGSWSRLAEPGMVAAALALAAIASAESLLSAAAVDRMHAGPRTRYDRELGAQGAGNVVCGLLGGLPMTGVIVRSSANVQAGAATRASTILHGFWLLAFVAILPWALALVPTSALAGILVVTGWRLVGPAHVLHLRARHGLPTALIWLATLLGVVCVDLLSGVLIGMGLSLAQSLPRFLGGRLRVEPIEAGAGLRLSGSATFLQLPGLSGALDALPRSGPVTLAAQGLRHVDHTCLEAIAEWAGRRGHPVHIDGGPAELRAGLKAA